MTDTCYITISRNGIVKLNKQERPRLDRGERFFQLEVNVPDSFFDPLPIPTVSVHVGDPINIVSPEIVVSEVQAEIKGLNETFRAQQQVNVAMARLLELALQSEDEHTQSQAVSILAGLKAGGIQVDVTVPGQEETL